MVAYNITVILCRDGTTDVTRTFHYGTPSDKVKVGLDFTVLGMLQHWCTNFCLLVFRPTAHDTLKPIKFHGRCCRVRFDANIKLHYVFLYNANSMIMLSCELVS